MKKIQIVGAGITGLALTYFLAKQNYAVELVDSQSIGAGASSIPCMFLHPFGGMRAKLNEYGLQGMEATLELLDIASNYSPPPIAKKTGLLRLATSEQQKRDFLECSHTHATVHWQDPGIFIENAYSINTQAYLKGLWAACESLGATFKVQKITQPQENTFFARFFALGADILSLFPDLPITPIKGQMIKVASSFTLPYPISGEVFLHTENSHCYIGSTYERYFSSSLPDSQAAQSLLAKAIKLRPELADAQILSHYTGVRASGPRHMPFIKQISPTCHIITGMGSKGLLYHALYARQLLGI